MNSALALDLALKFYNHASRRLDRFVETGWRRAFGWLGFAVGFFSYIYAPMHSLAVNYDAVNLFLTFSTGAFVARGVEKTLSNRATLSPSGGLVNNAALA